MHKNRASQSYPASPITSYLYRPALQSKLREFIVCLSASLACCKLVSVNVFVLLIAVTFTLIRFAFSIEDVFFEIVLLSCKIDELYLLIEPLID